MARTSFAKKETAAVEAAPVAAPEPADNTTTTLATRPTGPTGALIPSTDDFSGTWHRTDIRLPRINLVQKVSDTDLVTTFGIGSFVLAKTVRLSDGTTPFNLTALRVAKDYIQKVDFDSGEQPAVFNSPEEVAQNGGSLNYKDAKSGNYFQQRAHVQFVFAAPDGLTEEASSFFPYEGPDGVSYAMALMTVVSSAFTSVGKELATLRNSNKVMRNGLVFGNLTLTSLLKKKDTKSWHIPVVKYAGENPAALVEFYRSLSA